MANLRVGDEVNTRGGWRARIIWVRTDGTGLYAVHKPGEWAEAVPIFHLPNGAAVPILVVCPPPQYDGNPADLLL